VVIPFTGTEVVERKNVYVPLRSIPPGPYVKKSIPVMFRGDEKLLEA
jgi:hypothetical protein